MAVLDQLEEMAIEGKLNVSWRDYKSRQHNYVITLNKMRNDGSWAAMYMINGSTVEDQDEEYLALGTFSECWTHYSRWIDQHLESVSEAMKALTNLASRF